MNTLNPRLEAMLRFLVERTLAKQGLSAVVLITKKVEAEVA